jgi:hypothetical protein
MTAAQQSTPPLRLATVTKGLSTFAKTPRMTNPMGTGSGVDAARQALMRACAEATEAELEAALALSRHNTEFDGFRAMGRMLHFHLQFMSVDSCCGPDHGNLWRNEMRWVVLAATLSMLAGGPAVAQEGAACATKAVGKDGKALAGAAKASSMKKCCDTSAVGKDGKKLAGAAKASFMKKCEAGT